MAERSFEVTSTEFRLDGAPLRILSGALHYFRVPPEYWRHRLLAAKAMGLNTVETYVPWNRHEPEPGRFDFTGDLDLVGFIRLAQEVGLHVLFRPGPYICAEWEFGGLPWWLLRDPDMRVRTSYQPYLDAVDRWFDTLIPLVAPLQYSAGGPVLMVQVENEYGSYGDDAAYLKHLADGLRARGIDVPLFTSDGPEDNMLHAGTIPGILATANFGGGADYAFTKLREHRPDGPLMCMEFWCGWFDHWGEEHHTRTAEDAAGTLTDILTAGASVNIYMWHGGTNFGYFSGANRGERYEPTITSYDYDAPLTEWGARGPKYAAFQQVLARFGAETGAPPADPEPRGFGSVELTEHVGVLAALTPVGEFDPPPSMEAAGVGYGFLNYRKEFALAGGELRLPEVADRAQVFVDGTLVGVVERDDTDVVVLPAGSVLDILVENRGRVNYDRNYGPYLHDRKGLLGGVLLAGQPVLGWQVSTLPDGEFTFADAPVSGPALHRGRLDIAEPADTFVDLTGWDRGVLWVNGVNLGRFLLSGPQRRLFLPAPLLRAGTNEFVVLGLADAPASATISLVAEPDLG